ncbi:hypothetical protein [Curtobacterium sp. MCBD17_032]|uniref:hypothetical protein n=1 Tax=Curtobacterium sp. MCBD17_032 TaxID=2175659 RepID=UPI000DA83ECD|nr:hypothetical protein [Curtobacterium sp. MCBD17_032]PZE84133.1 hypothetical protein DEI91_09565 [Curtobacterium sp. MCBD17_032]
MRSSPSTSCSLADTDYARGYLAVVVPVVVLLGVFTYERLVQTSLEDVVALAAMQRIRRWYGTILPGAGRYFPLPGTRAAPNELIDIGLRLSWRGVFSTLSSAIAGVNCIVAGAGAALAASSVTGPGGTVVTGVVTAAVLAVLHGLYQERRYARVLALLRQVESAPPHDAAQHP